MSTKSALVVMAAGAEEMETVIVVDVLRRAGLEVTLAGLSSDEPVHCSRHVRIVPDAALKQVQADWYDVVVLPGGAGGARALADSPEVGSILRRHHESGRLIAAVCAAPTALLRHGIAKGALVTSHPSVSAELGDYYRLSDDVVVKQPGLITSRGPGTCFDFALAIVEELLGAAVAAQVRGPMMLT